MRQHELERARALRVHLDGLLAAAGGDRRELLAHQPLRAVHLRERPRDRAHALARPRQQLVGVRDLDHRARLRDDPLHHRAAATDHAARLRLGQRELEHGWRCRPDLVAVDNPDSPREYLGKFWVDSITHDARLMQYVLELQGADKVVMGSDYPFPLGDLEFGRYIETDMDLSEADRSAIFHGSALSWLGLEPGHFG